MKHYNKYLIHSNDQFDPDSFSSVNEEIDIINEKTGSLPAPFKVEIIISFLKDHSFQNDWITANPGLTELITSGNLFTGNIESLFASSSNNPAFRQALESYLKERFTKA